MLKSSHDPIHRIVIAVIVAIVMIGGSATISHSGDGQSCDRSLNFTFTITQKADRSGTYTATELTLHRVVGGTATTSAMREQEFARY